MAETSNSEESVPEDNDSINESTDGMKIGRRFIVGKYITRGSFGRIYRGKNIQRMKRWP